MFLKLFTFKFNGFRVITWWKTKTPENVIKGYKVNLQHALGTWVPNGVLNFLFKHSYSRKVSVLKINM